MRLRLLPFAATALALAGCTTVQNPPSTGVPGMVSAADPRAAAAGAEMLREGGTAADAAAATLLALNVVEPQSSGIGGGGYLVYSDHGGAPATYDGRETAPAAATGTWFFKDGQPMAFPDAQPGGKSVGVPGNIRLMALAWHDHGSLPWAARFQPAIRLARDGFAITPRLHDSLDHYRATGAFSAAARAMFYNADGSVKAVGTVVRNPTLAVFLEQVAARGADSFYVGPNAQAIAAAVSGSPHNPAPMTAGDIAAYSAKPRPAVCGTYRGYRICGMGPSSSGETTVFGVLKQLERFNLSSLGPNNPTSWHLIADSMRLVYADRDRYLGDSDFVPVPVAGLVDPGYLASRSALISPDHALASIAAGTPPEATPVAAGLEGVEHGTSHFVAVDRWGDVASETSTVESAFGSGIMVNGYYLNNELTDFSFTPTAGGLPVANRAEAGKRPRSAMSPTIVYGPDGHIRLVVGAAGGATIPAQVLKTIIGVIDWHLPVQQAVALPTIFAPGDTVYLESGTFLAAMASQLQAMGHAIDYRPPTTFKGNAIEWIDGHWSGAADPRSEGAVVAQ